MDDMDKEALIVNCDGTYPLDSVVSLLESVSNDIGVHVDPQQKIFPLSQLQAVSEEVRQRQLLCGVFVVNAYESRLSINEDRAGIGYAVLYRALLEAAQGRVLVVIGGDDRYKAGEQDTSVLSTWAYHKIAAQFDDTYLDGRLGFVFSWDERHNPVHQEALGSYLRAITAGQPGLQQPFTPTPPLPKPEQTHPPFTDQRKSQIPQTDPKFQAHEDPGFHLGPKKDSRDSVSETSAKYERARSHLPVYEGKYTDEEVVSIRETLEKHMNDIRKENPRRKIKFVGHLVYGKLVPGFGTFKIHSKTSNPLEGIPNPIVHAIKGRSVHMESASVIVFDDETAQNCFIVRELTVRKLNKNSDGTSVSWYKKPLVWFGINVDSKNKQK